MWKCVDGKLSASYVKCIRQLVSEPQSSCHHTLKYEQHESIHTLSSLLFVFLCVCKFLGIFHLHLHHIKQLLVETTSGIVALHRQNDKVVEIQSLFFTFETKVKDTFSSCSRAFKHVTGSSIAGGVLKELY